MDLRKCFSGFEALICHCNFPILVTLPFQWKGLGMRSRRGRLVSMSAAYGCPGDCGNRRAWMPIQFPRTLERTVWAPVAAELESAASTQTGTCS